MTVWYIERAGGILAFALLSASVILGLTLSGIAAGTDRATVWALALYIGTASVVAGLTAGRFADTLTAWMNPQPSRQ